MDIEIIQKKKEIIQFNREEYYIKQRIKMV